MKINFKKENFSKIRKSRGLSQEDLAKLAKVDIEYIKDLEDINCSSKPRHNHIIIFAFILSCPVRDIATITLDENEKVDITQEFTELTKEQELNDIITEFIIKLKFQTIEKQFIILDCLVALINQYPDNYLLKIVRENRNSRSKD